jgi:hypothetical protein
MIPALSNVFDFVRHFKKASGLINYLNNNDFKGLKFKTKLQKIINRQEM